MKTVIKYILFSFFYYFFRIFPIQKNKIFFQNFNGKGYGCNPKYIAEEILRRKLGFILIWAALPEFSDNFPKEIKTVSYKSIRSVYEQVTSKFWIDNCRKQLYVKKRKAQFYIQTWHGIGPKKCEKDVEQTLSPYYLKQAKNDSKLIDLFLSDSKFATDLFSTSFWYTGEIRKYGFPRNDIFVNNNQFINAKVKKFFDIPDKTKIILYAPTFRNISKMEIYNIDYKAILNCLNKKEIHSFVFLIRLHPNIINNAKSFVYNKFFINASYYNDMQELLFASDILITDYSSCMTEFALMKKPVFLHLIDYDNYTTKERDFYYNLFSLPFPIALTESELLSNINKFNYASYLIAVNNYLFNYNFINDGKAAKRIINRILIELKNQGGK